MGWWVLVWFDETEPAKHLSRLGCRSCFEGTMGVVSEDCSLAP